MKKDDTTRQKLAKVFEDFEAEPQPETWEHIRAAIQKKKKKRPFLWFFFAAGLVLLVGIGFYNRTPSKQTHANQPSQRTNTGKTLPMNSDTSRSSTYRLFFVWTDFARWICFCCILFHHTQWP